ncbi:MAG: hypothetical protein AAGE89_05375 [Pseudomonadota bacterium]
MTSTPSKTHSSNPHPNRPRFERIFRAFVLVIIVAVLGPAIGGFFLGLALGGSVLLDQILTFPSFSQDDLASLQVSNAIIFAPLTFAFFSFTIGPFIALPAGLILAFWPLKDRAITIKVVMSVVAVTLVGGLALSVMTSMGAWRNIFGYWIVVSACSIVASVILHFTVIRPLFNR